MHVRDPEKVKSFKRKKIGKSSFTHKRALLDPGAKGDSFLGHLESSQQVLTYLVTDSSQPAGIFLYPATPTGSEHQRRHRAVITPKHLDSLLAISKPRESWGALPSLPPRRTVSFSSEHSVGEGPFSPQRRSS